MDLLFNWVFITIFLIYTCSRVVGIKKIYAAQGESVVLTCPQRSDNSKTTWLGPPNFIQYGDGAAINDNLEKRDKLRILGNFSVGEFNLEILNFSSVDEGLYRCTVIVNESACQYDFHMMFASAPVVNITIAKEGEHTNLTCLAGGLPNSYIFSEWEHKSFFGEHIRFLNGSSNGVLILPVNASLGISYEDNGVYICGVNNGIKRNGKLVQKAYTDVRYEDKPVFVLDNVKVQYGSYGKSTTITTYIYSYPKHTVFCCQTKKWKMCQHTHPFVFKEENAVIRDIRHGVEVLVHGCKITYTTTVLKPSDFHLYTFEVTNGLGSDQLFVELRTEAIVPNQDEDAFNTTIKAKDIKTEYDYMPYVVTVATFVVILVMSNVCNYYIQKRRHQQKRNNELHDTSAHIDDTTGGAYFEIDQELELSFQQEDGISLHSLNCIAEASVNITNTLDTSAITNCDDSQSSSSNSPEFSLSCATSQVKETEYETLEPNAQSRDDHAYMECIAQQTERLSIDAPAKCDILSSVNLISIECDVSSRDEPATMVCDISKRDTASTAYDSSGSQDPVSVVYGTSKRDPDSKVCDSLSILTPASTAYDSSSSKDSASTTCDSPRGQDPASMASDSLSSGDYATKCVNRCSSFTAFHTTIRDDHTYEEDTK